MPALLSVAIIGHLPVAEVSHFVSAAALSTMLTTVTGVSVGNGLISAMDTLSSQAVGAGKPHLLGLHLRTGVLVTGGAFLLMFLVNWNAGWLLQSLGQDPTVSALAGTYSRITVFGLPGLFLYELTKRALLAQNIASPMVAIAVVSNVVYVGLAYAFCYHSCLGFYGAAVAWVVSNTSLALLPLAYLSVSRSHESWQITHSTWAEACLHAPVFLRLGSAGMAMMLMEWWAFELMALLAGMLASPVVAVSVHAIVATISTTVYSVFLGVSVATGVRVGQLIGADNVDDARRMATLCLWLTGATGAVVALALYVLHDSLPVWMVANDATIAQARRTLVVLAVFEVMDAVNCTAKGVLRAMGKQHIGVYVSILAYYVVGVPIAASLGLHWATGVPGLWAGLAAGVSFSAVALVGVISRPANWSSVVNHATSTV
ncbi:Multidrug/Oligosaccharidyl-lipid/Polysaccharide (MOP) Flippase Superfamily [Achlya hypogyna]|uniref:Multidrug/Oligosaccharidyl-lipid/Polysaccharide (MOP) Flippase Superfamily n=1 Tax=Achlya hypogyna TaxID=1202772 RepID=A0A1V9YYX9_ACHHY|nr:Multidrug/Oligosaccharidyl-lipid/Polysaccharide (MOP) Flippase Superfamily [Achlya hypogyna]